MLTPTLHEFIKIVPSLEQTTRLSSVLEIFSQGQCDRLVALDEQRCPVGLVSLRRLLPHLMSSYENETSLDVRQPLSTLGLDILKPILTLPADLNVEQFGFYVRSQQSQTNTNADWALVDQVGKFLGLLDSPRMLQFLALSSPIIMGTGEREQIERCVLDSLVRLLQQLPWPMLLQTGTGEVVMQNPAWWQQFGGLSDPEAVRREVEGILAIEGAGGARLGAGSVEAGLTDTSECAKTRRSNSLQNSAFRTNWSATVEPAKEEPFLTEVAASLPIDNAYCQPPAETGTSSSNRCQLGSQPGSCICVWPLNGQERVFSFVKIPLQESGVRGQGSGVRGQESGVRSQESEKSEFISPSPPLHSPLSTNLWLLLAQDVTEQQQLCKELTAKNADLIQLNRLKDEFLACISHELKTPLTAVLGLSNLLKEQTLGQLNERQARYARLIYQSSRHLMTVVNDILDLTRMETGQMELTLDPVQITNVCERAIEQARSLQTKTNQSEPSEQSIAASGVDSSVDHHFTLFIEPGLDNIVADELRLRQMLVHLLSNAFKFTEAGGSLGLRVNRWEGWIAFTVWDTGIGISEHQQHLIFQKFQQLENPLTRRFEGAGLGLVLTRALARMHGGDVSFLSKKGQGSQFTLLLPPSPPRSGFADGELGSWGVGERTSPHHPSTVRLSAPGEAPAPQHSTYSQRLVLIVEAAPRFIEDVTEKLTSLGYRVVIARSGTEALEKVRRLQPVAIFLNPLLPLLSGWDVLTLLKSDVTTRQIPVIVTSTRAEKKQAFLNQADDFLSLPVQQEALQQILTRFCAQPSATAAGRGIYQKSRAEKPLTILRLVREHEGLIRPTHLSPQVERGEEILSHTPFMWGEGKGSSALDASPLNYRVLEADDLDQAELLARVWRPDVVLLDGAIPYPLTYLKKFSQYGNLAAIPLVTLDAATTEAANQISGLSVFPCFTPTPELGIDALLSVLQIAAGMSWKPNILVVDIATLPDLQEVKKSQSSTPNPPLSKTGVEESEKHSSVSLGSEWFQALIQYLQTAGFKGLMGHSWAEVQQQIRQQSVDLVLICLRDSRPHPDVIAALGDLPGQQGLPPVLVLDQRHGGSEVNVESLENALRAIAKRILPQSLSMEELLNQIYQTLAIK